MLNHAVAFGLVEVHPPRLNPIKRVPPLLLRDGVAWSVGAATLMRSLSGKEVWQRTEVIAGTIWTCPSGVLEEEISLSWCTMATQRGQAFSGETRWHTR